MQWLCINRKEEVQLVVDKIINRVASYNLKKRSTKEFVPINCNDGLFWCIIASFFDKTTLAAECWWLASFFLIFGWEQVWTCHAAVMLSNGILFQVQMGRFNLICSCLATWSAQENWSTNVITTPFCVNVQLVDSVIRLSNIISTINLVQPASVTISYRLVWSTDDGWDASWISYHIFRTHQAPKLRNGLNSLRLQYTPIGSISPSFSLAA